MRRIRFGEWCWLACLLALPVCIYIVALAMPPAFDGTRGQAEFPKNIAIIWFLLDLVYIFRRVNGLESAPHYQKYIHLGRLGILIAASVAYALLLPHIGYIFATILYIAVADIMFGVSSKMYIACSSTGFALASFLLFEHALGIELPKVFTYL